MMILLYSVLVKFHLTTATEARYQVTTKPLLKKSSKGKIQFAGGYLGSIEESSVELRLAVLEKKGVWKCREAC